MSEEITEGAIAPADETPVSESEQAPETTQSSEAASEPTLDDDLMAVYEKHNRPRDENGRFVGENDDEPISEEDQTPTEDATEPDDALAIEAPQSWSAEMKAKWAELPSEAREYIAQREQQSHEAISRQGQELAAMKPVREVLEQGKGVFEKYGMDMTEGVERMMSVVTMLENDPASAIQELAEAYGVNLQQATSDGQRMQGQQTPETARLVSEINRLKSEIGQIKQQSVMSAKKEQEAQYRTIENQIAEFAKGKADFADLEEDIYAEIIALKQGNPDIDSREALEKAYERARWANPKTREQALKDLEAKKVQDAKKRTEAAKKAAPLNVKSATANSSTPRSMDETLAEIARRHYGT